MTFNLRAAAAAALAAALLGSAAAPPATAHPNNHHHNHGHHNDVRKVTRAVTVGGVLDHLQAFQRISNRHGDRAAGKLGYAASTDYVVKRLKRAGYRPQVQEFPFTYYEENSELERLSPSPRSFAEGTDFLRNSFDSGIPEGVATNAIYVVEPGGTTSGCEATDFADMPDGAIALMQRGTCGFAVKALNAQQQGASGAVIWNNADGLVSMIGDATGLRIPTVFATQEAGAALASTPGAQVRVRVDYVADERISYNVTAETRRGNDNNVVMAGAHLDSVQGGAGINDNGSGSAALLETAIQMKKVKPRNTVRFAWWGAEEEGLLGSEYYVSQLSAQQQEDIALYLNFDMVASPNYMFGIYDGDNSGGTAAPGFIPEGSAQIEDVFERFYAKRGEPFQDSEFSGRSDYGPFIAVGIPAGGLFTGAEEPKTPEEAALYGGVAGAAYDPCYHQACDNLRGTGQDAALYAQLREDYRLRGNINKHALDVNSDAIATAVVKFARSTWRVNGESGHPGKGPYKGKVSKQMLAEAQGRSTR